MQISRLLKFHEADYIPNFPPFINKVSAGTEFDVP